jgi:hypothetical protein
MTDERDKNWAASALLGATSAPADAINLNVTGKRVASPIQGFGQLWQKTYSTKLIGAKVTPAELVTRWKADYASFWPKGSRFYGSLAGIRPGETALLNLDMPGGMKVATGILVLYADDESFTFMTPEGHAFAGWITFSAAADGDVTVATVSVLIRASDPLGEVGLLFGVHRLEDRQWEHTLRALAEAHGVADAEVTTTRVLVDRRRQWRRAGNIWQSSAIRTLLYTLTHPRLGRARATRR